MIMIRQILLVFSLLISFSYSNTIEFDYCVADLTLAHGPTGYTCKDPTTVAPNDFTYSGLKTPGNTSSTPFKSGVSPAFVTQFPGLNGLGISMVRADMAIGGVVPLHTHRVTELIIVVKGTILAGFIDTNNMVFYKTIEEGDLFVIPRTLVHFQVNVGKVAATIYASFGSANPGVQIVSNALFQTDLPTHIVQKITLLDLGQIRKLKMMFGGTN